MSLRAFEVTVMSVAWAIAAALVLAFIVLLCSCASARLAPYAGELEACREFSGSCEAYVSCRRSVARKYGRTFEGTCSDGGAP